MTQTESLPSHPIMLCIVVQVFLALMAIATITAIVIGVFELGIRETWKRNWPWTLSGSRQTKTACFWPV